MTPNSCSRCNDTCPSMFEVFETRFSRKKPSANNDYPVSAVISTAPQRKLLCSSCLVGATIPVQRTLATLPEQERKWEMAKVVRFDTTTQQIHVKYMDKQIETFDDVDTRPFRRYIAFHRALDEGSYRKRKAIPLSAPSKAMFRNRDNTEEEEDCCDLTLERISAQVAFSPVRLSPSEEREDLLRCTSINTFGDDQPIIASPQKRDWTPVDDYTVFDSYRRLGSKWTLVAKLVKGFAPEAVKDRFLFLKATVGQDYKEAAEGMVPLLLEAENSDVLGDLMEKIQFLLPSIARKSLTAANHFFPDDFGPFSNVEEACCARCSLVIPSAHTGAAMCTRSGWCHACTQIPAYVTGSMLRECLSMRAGGSPGIVESRSAAHQDKENCCL